MRFLCGRRADAGTETQDCVRRLRNRRSSQRLYRMRYGKCAGTSVDLLLPSQTQPYLRSAPGWRLRAGARPYTIPDGAAVRHRHAHLGTYEAGLQRIPVDQALKLSAYGIPLEWVYQGKTANLHPHIRAKIASLEAEEREARPRYTSEKAPPKRGLSLGGLPKCE